MNMQCRGNNALPVGSQKYAMMLMNKKEVMVAMPGDRTIRIMTCLSLWELYTSTYQGILYNS